MYLLLGCFLARNRLLICMIFAEIKKLSDTSEKFGLFAFRDLKIQTLISRKSFS